MKVLEVVTYYRPHVSGLTIYVERLCRALARQGHDITVLTSHYDSNTPRTEVAAGVNIIRVPVAFRVSKGVIMPTFGLVATDLARQADVIHLHLPQFDAPGLAARGRLFGKPVVLTYHSDLQLPPGAFNRLVGGVVSMQNRLAGYLADVVVTYTSDFGRHSPFLSIYADRKLVVIPPPVELDIASDSEAAEFCRQHALEGKKVIGICTRLAAEKGIEIVLQALPAILKRFPNALVLHAGPYQHIIGEEAYAARLQPQFDRFEAHYHLLGTLQGSKLSAFYRNLDCLVVSSLNNTETFGLVQIEAMINNVPSIASNLPGVRQPVQMTGMGEIAPIGDADALAESVIRVLSRPSDYSGVPRLIAETFSPDETANAYLSLFDGLLDGKRYSVLEEPNAYRHLRAAHGRAEPST